LSEEQQRANRRLAWILATVAIVFGLGFVAKIAWLGP
jgi:CHASE3 domain sensor protein